MSGVVTGISKVFTSVAGKLSTSLGSAVTGVGGAVATVGAAGSGAGSLALNGGGALSHILQGASKLSSNVIAPVGNGLATASGGGSLLSKAGNFLMSEQGAGLVGGLAKGYGAYEEQRMKEKELEQQDRMDQRLYDYKRQEQQRVTDSYGVPTSALPNGASTGVVQDAPRPTPAVQYGRDFDLVYDPELMRIVRKPQG